MKNRVFRNPCPGRFVFEMIFFVFCGLFVKLEKGKICEIWLRVLSCISFKIKIRWVSKNNIFVNIVTEIFFFLLQQKTYLIQKPCNKINMPILDYVIEKIVRIKFIECQHFLSISKNLPYLKKMKILVKNWLKSFGKTVLIFLILCIWLTISLCWLLERISNAFKI